LFNFEGLVPHFNLYFENCIQESKVPEKVKRPFKVLQLRD